jgi:hypothetical protein
MAPYGSVYYNPPAGLAMWGIKGLYQCQYGFWNLIQPEKPHWALGRAKVARPLPVLSAGSQVRLP